MTERQRRVMCLLSDGQKHSVIGIMQSLNIADPRSTIRDLRKMGIVVHDEWRDTIEGNRFKMYWIDKQRPYEK